MGFGYWTDKHIEAERKLNLRSAVEKAGGDAEKLKDIRGHLAPLLRDTLLAFNYAHYAPPGAQILYTNPTFVRSHDFLGMQGTAHTWRATETYGTGWPSNAGGRLVGSLSTLPYALAEAEQNFLIPAQTQALIWGDLVPQMILSAKIPRWWNVTPAQVHWVGLHMRYGRELLAEAALDPELRKQVVDTLWLYAAPARTSTVARLLEQGDVKGAVDQRHAVRAVLDRARPRGQERRRRLLRCWPRSKRLHEARRHLRRRLARFRHAQADPGQLLRAGAAGAAHLPRPDGLLQPHHGRELGIQHAVLGGAGRRDAHRAGLAQRAHPRMDAEAGRADLRVAPGGLAGPVEVAAPVGDDVRARSRAATAAEKAASSRSSEPVNDHDDFATRIHQYRRRRRPAARPGHQRPGFRVKVE